VDEPKPPERPELRDTGMMLFGLPVYETSDVDAPPIQLGTTAGGLHFTPGKPAEPREPITIPKEVNVSLSGTFLGIVPPEDSPIWRHPIVMAANRANN